MTTSTYYWPDRGVFVTFTYALWCVFHARCECGFGVTSQKLSQARAAENAMNYHDCPFSLDAA